MPAKKRPKSKRKISFRVQVTVLNANGDPVPGIDPTITVEWGQSFATDWHEAHQDMAVRTMMRDLQRRVEAAA